MECLRQPLLPALYFADAQERIRHHHFGEGEYQQPEMVIQQLLAEAGTTDHGHELVPVDPRGPEVPADWASLRPPETYTGYERTENFASPDGGLPGKPHVYSAPAQLLLNHWALSGNWTMEEQAATVNELGGQIAYRFHARDLNLVAGPAAPGTRCDSGCSWPGSRRTRRTEPTLSARATSPLPPPNSVFTSSSANPDRSPSVPSKSRSSTPDQAYSFTFG